MTIQRQPLYAGCIALAGLFAACGGSESESTDLSGIAQLKASPLQWKNCAEQAQGNKAVMKDCLIALGEGTAGGATSEDRDEGDSGGDSECEYFHRSCIEDAFAAAEDGSEIDPLLEECDHDYLGCMGWHEECHEPVILCWDDFENGAGGCEVVDFVDNCMPENECEAQFEVCMESCEDDHHLELECEAQRLICEGVPEECAYDYAECEYNPFIHDDEDVSFGGRNGHPTIDPEASPLHDPGYDDDEPVMPPYAPPYYDCERILEDCHCAEPPAPPLCPGGYEPGERFPSADGCNTCFCDEDGSITCTERACYDPGPPRPEPMPFPEPCNDGAGCGGGQTQE